MRSKLNDAMTEVGQDIREEGANQTPPNAAPERDELNILQPQACEIYNDTRAAIERHTIANRVLVVHVKGRQRSSEAFAKIDSKPHFSEPLFCINIKSRHAFPTTSKRYTGSRDT